MQYLLKAALLYLVIASPAIAQDFSACASDHALSVNIMWPDGDANAQTLGVELEGSLKAAGVHDILLPITPAHHMEYYGGEIGVGVEIRLPENLAETALPCATAIADFTRAQGKSPTISDTHTVGNAIQVRIGAP
jgi:hypothetical protein